MPKLLLVEDDNNLREIYEARLQAEGYEIVSAKDGEEALAVAKAEKPDLVISDIMMPKISGFEMLDILRNTDGLKNIKIIMLTALGQSDDQERANKLGADKYLVKSQVTLEDIVRVSHELLGDTPPPPQPVETAPTPAISSPPAATTTLGQSPPQPVASEPPVTTTLQPDPLTTQTTSTPPVLKTLQTPPTNDDNNAPPPIQAQTTSEEEAKVESEIEDFVSGASSDATPSVTTPTDQPVSSPTPSEEVSIPEEPVSPVSIITPDQQPPSNESPETPAENTASDDKLMNDGKAEESTSSPIVVTSSVTPPPDTDEQEDKPTIDNTASADDPANNNVTIAHKKVISPLQEETKPDIQTLYEVEQSKEAANSDSSEPPKIVTSDDTAKAKSDKPEDPNTIAL
jgi:CheY-like chemotaxis protein